MAAGILIESGDRRQIQNERFHEFKDTEMA